MLGVLTLLSGNRRPRNDLLRNAPRVGLCYCAHEISGGWRMLAFSSRFSSSEKRLDRIELEPERAADPQAPEFVPLGEPVYQGRADSKAACNFADRHQALVWAGIRREFAHHGRTKRRLNQSVLCHPIRTRRLRLNRIFPRLRRDATQGHAVGFFSRQFGTRGSQVQILSPRL